MNQETLTNTLKSINYPGYSRDIVSFGLVQKAIVENGKAIINVSLSTANEDIPNQIKKDVENALKPLSGINSVEVHIQNTLPTNKPLKGAAKPEAMKGVKHIIAVSSGKGGVGKSTITTNLACAMDQILTSQGKPNSVGILDCDIYGPSIPLMLGAQYRPEIEDDMLLPLENFGIKAISMGCLIDENMPVVWRGPMITKAIRQFTTHVKWGALEVLLIDFPPGTGDAHLTLVQSIPVDGALVITTPQTAATQVAQRGAMMFEKVEVPILGVIENMSYIEGQEDPMQRYLFGKGGGETTAKVLGAPLLGQIGLDPYVRRGSDEGIPIVVGNPERNIAQTFINISNEILRSIKT